MAERRMFAKTIIDSDAFLDMPLSAQALYFHLSMRADDEGFVGNPKRIRSMIGASEDDLKLLLMKRFLLAFDSGVVVIKHWKIHNYIQNDRCKPTTYIEERATLDIDGKKAYVEKTDTPRIQDGYNSDTQVSLDEDRVSLELDLQESKKENINNNSSTGAGVREGRPLESYNDIMTRWELGPLTKAALGQFIQHCALNGKKLTNAKLEDIICRICDSYGYPCVDGKIDNKIDHEQSSEVYRAIEGGYFDIKVMRR